MTSAGAGPSVRPLARPDPWRPRLFPWTLPCDSRCRAPPRACSATSPWSARALARDMPLRPVDQSPRRHSPTPPHSRRARRTPRATLARASASVVLAPRGSLLVGCLLLPRRQRRLRRRRLRQLCPRRRRCPYALVAMGGDAVRRRRRPSSSPPSSSSTSYDARYGEPGRADRRRVARKHPFLGREEWTLRAAVGEAGTVGVDPATQPMRDEERSELHALSDAMEESEATVASERQLDPAQKSARTRKRRAHPRRRRAVQGMVFTMLARCLFPRIPAEPRARSGAVFLSVSRRIAAFRGGVTCCGALVESFVVAAVLAHIHVHVDRVAQRRGIGVLPLGVGGCRRASPRASREDPRWSGPRRGGRRHRVRRRSSCFSQGKPR